MREVAEAALAAACHRCFRVMQHLAGPDAVSLAQAERCGRCLLPRCLREEAQRQVQHRRRGWRARAAVGRAGAACGPASC